MSGDIVERLRGWVPGDFWNRAVGEMRDAADEIERLRAERDASRLMISDLTAEVERLRAAGDALAEAVEWWGGGNAVADSDDFHPSAVRIYPGLRFGLPAFGWEHNGRWGWSSTREGCISQALLAHEEARRG